MSKILILGQSGSGKSTSIGTIPELNHIGLEPNETFIISCTNKPLPFKGSAVQYPVGTPDSASARRYIADSGSKVANCIEYISTSREEIKNIVIDDMNYVLQDNYMRNAMTSGFDIFKKMGYDFSQIFLKMENVRPDLNVICIGHYEEFRANNSDGISYRFKTVGKMVQDYMTPEGKFEIVLFTKQVMDPETKQMRKVFVTNFDGQFPAKTPIGMFEELEIPNDLGIVVKKVKEYYNN